MLIFNPAFGLGIPGRQLALDSSGAFCFYGNTFSFLHNLTLTTS